MWVGGEGESEGCGWEERERVGCGWEEREKVGVWVGRGESGVGGRRGRE